MHQMESSKVALVTGSSRGIGAQTALLFAATPFDINYLNAKVQAESLKQEILAKGVQSSCLQADVSDENAVARIAEADKLGLLAALVNNAGALDKQSLLKTLAWNVSNVFLRRRPQRFYALKPPFLVCPTSMAVTEES